MSQTAQALQKRWLWLVVNISAALPLAWTAWDYWRGSMIDPVDSFTIRTGQAAIILLLLTLAVTPIITLTDYRKLIGVRKSLGLWSFAYATLHLVVFVALEYGFSLEFILKDGIATKPYIIVGTISLLVMLPLAVTSTRGWMRRLGRNWKRLHKWIYAAAILAVIHYIWVVKVPIGKPTYYAVILAILLIARIPPVRRALASAGRRLRGGQSAPAKATSA